MSSQVSLCGAITEIQLSCVIAFKSHNWIYNNCRAIFFLLQLNKFKIGDKLI